jgi:hypothetical protein
MDYKGSDLTISELLSALHTKVIDLSERKGRELGATFTAVRLTLKTAQFHPEWPTKICRSEVHIHLYHTVH